MLRCQTEGCEFEESAQEITDQFIFCLARFAGPLYTGSRFKYCPWCGSKLIEDDDLQDANVYREPA